MSALEEGVWEVGEGGGGLRDVSERREGRGGGGVYGVERIHFDWNGTQWFHMDDLSERVEFWKFR